MTAFRPELMSEAEKLSKFGQEVTWRWWWWRRCGWLRWWQWRWWLTFPWILSFFKHFSCSLPGDDYNRGDVGSWGGVWSPWAEVPGLCWLQLGWARPGQRRRRLHWGVFFLHIVIIDFIEDLMLRAKPMNASLSDVRGRQMKKLAEVAVFFLLEHWQNLMTLMRNSTKVTAF